jgi:hypothetical protein
MEMEYETTVGVINKYIELANHPDVRKAMNDVIGMIGEPNPEKRIKNPLYVRQTKQRIKNYTQRLTNEIKQMIMSGDVKAKYHLSVNDLNNIFNMATVVTSEYLVIKATRKGKNVDFMIKVPGVEMTMIDDFLEIIQEKIAI